MENNKQPSPDSWIAAIMWLALLLALLVTSRYALTLPFTNAEYLGLVGGYTRGEAEDPTVLDFVNLGFVVLMIVQLGAAWFRFLDVTQDIITASAKGENLLANFLVYLVDDSEAEDEQEAPNPLLADYTDVGKVLRSLGYTWLVLMLAPPITVIVGKLFSNADSL